MHETCENWHGVVNSCVYYVTKQLLWYIAQLIVTSSSEHEKNESVCEDCFLWAHYVS